MRSERKTETLEVKSRVRPALKRDAERVFKRYNLSTSQAINLFFHAVAESKSLILNLRMPNKETIEVMKELKNGVGLKKFNSAQEMLDDLHSDDIEE
ncbi:MAG: type II toxin-antitoxin system RelB/DinJ family antitoxin [Candidatus Berkiellales bacterium]